MGSNNGLFMPVRDESIAEYRRQDAYQASLEIQALVERINRGDCVSGPTFSGGFDLIALPEPEPERPKFSENPFEDIAWDIINRGVLE